MVRTPGEMSRILNFQYLLFEVGKMKDYTELAPRTSINNQVCRLDSLEGRRIVRKTSLAPKKNLIEFNLITYEAKPFASRPNLT